MNPEYEKISYFQLIKTAFNGKNSRLSSYTNFSTCTLINDNLNFRFKEHIEYINWYQSTMFKYGEIKSESNWLRRNIIRSTNIINAITTMNWFSPIPTLVTGFIVIIIFSLIYCFLFNSFFIGLTSYGRSLNFSVQIFTSLGFGDMKPDLNKGILGSVLISIECALGYFWIALTLMVFGKRIFR